MNTEQVTKICSEAINTITGALGAPLGEAISKAILDSYSIGFNDCNKLKAQSFWATNREEPKELDRKICIYHPNFRDKIIICDKYNPSDKNFYYDDDEHYCNIPLNYVGLKWTYIDFLIPE